jgi:hypothetical protein
MIKVLDKVYTNAHPVDRIEPERVEVAGMTHKQIKALPGKTISEKLKKLGIKVPINITLEKAIKLLQKKTYN